MGTNFVIGIISGLVATTLVFLFRSLWTSAIVPWFEERVYKDIRIEGSWIAFHPDSDFVRLECVNIKRNGHAVSGTMVCTSGPDLGETYCLIGSFRNMLLPMIYESADRSKSDRGSITLKCTKNGERMVGKICLYDDQDDAIRTGTLIWFREKKDFDEYQERHNKKEARSRSLNKGAADSKNQSSDAGEPKVTVPNDANRTQDKGSTRHAGNS